MQRAFIGPEVLLELLDRNFFFSSGNVFEVVMKLKDMFFWNDYSSLEILG